MEHRWVCAPGDRRDVRGDVVPVDSDSRWHRRPLEHRPVSLLFRLGYQGPRAGARRQREACGTVSSRLESHAVTMLDVYGSLFFAGARTLAEALPSAEGVVRPAVVLRLRGRSSARRHADRRPRRLCGVAGRSGRTVVPRGRQRACRRAASKLGQTRHRWRGSSNSSARCSRRVDEGGARARRRLAARFARLAREG